MNSEADVPSCAPSGHKDDAPKTKENDANRIEETGDNLVTLREKAGAEVSNSKKVKKTVVKKANSSADQANVNYQAGTTVKKQGDL